MKKAFPGYFSNDPETLKDIWGRCLFILDANVLLSLYRYSNETRSELFEIFELLNDRLWIPHQVASEYLINRVGVIGQQVKVYDDAIKSVEDLRRSFENPKQHPFVEGDTLKDVVVSFERVVADLGANKKVYLQKIELDDVKAKLEVLLDDRVGEALTDEEVADVLTVGPARYLQKTPPGYKDSKKGGDSEVVSDKLKPFGDYIVWRQTLAKAKTDGLPVIFVTGDSKEDWWSIYSGKPIEPHPQLVDEFVKEVGQSFFMYLPEKFMERANAFLNRVTSQSAVDEIVDVRAEEMADIIKSKNFVLKNNLIMRGGTHEEGRRALMEEINFVEVKMKAMQPVIGKLEFNIERITAERQENIVRYTHSLDGGNGTETANSTRLSFVINQLGAEIEMSKNELETMRRNYHELSLQLAHLTWKCNSLTVYVSDDSTTAH